MSEMQATWRRPTSAARPGAQASPPTPPRPARDPPAPSIPVFPGPDRASPRAAPRRERLSRKPAGRKGRPPRRVRGLLCGTALPPSPAAPGHPIGPLRVGDTRLGAYSPLHAPAPLDTPGPPGSLGRIPLRGRPPEPRGSERYPRRRPAPGVRPSVPAGRGAKGRGSRRGPWVPATPTLGSPAPERREPRAPNGRRTRPGPSRRHRRKGTPRRRQHAAPAAASGPHLRPLLLAFPSARRNAANFLKTKMFSPRDTHERDERDTTMRALRLRNANWPRATLLSAETHLPRRRGGCNGCAERGETLKRQNDIQLQIVSK